MTILLEFFEVFLLRYPQMSIHGNFTFQKSNFGHNGVCQDPTFARYKRCYALSALQVQRVRTQANMLEYNIQAIYMS